MRRVQEVDRNAGGPPGDVDPLAREVEAEQVHVSAMYRLLDERTARARSDLTRVLGTRADDAAQAHERETAAANLTRQLARLEGAEHALCFGRIDGTDGTALHIGRLGLRTDDRELPLLVDWRADVARPFYAATTVHPMRLRRRRHLRTTGRTVVGLSDEVLDGPPRDGDVVGDGPLTEALEAGRTVRMRAAVATLQEEQDAIVRSPHRGVTVVSGGPGTGKTVVALHRAAYVLYAFEHVTDHGVLVLGPNPRFLDYIAQVLPSLGENDVVLTTCTDLAGVSPTGRDEDAVARLKGRAVLAEGLARFVRSHQTPSGAVAIRVGREQVQLDPAVVAETRAAAVGSGLAHNHARAVFAEHLVDALADEVDRRTHEDLSRIDAQTAQLTSMDLDRAAAADLSALGFDGVPAGDLTAEFDPDAVRAELAGDPQVARAVEALWPRLRPAGVVRRFLSDADALATCLPSLSADERAGLLGAADAPWTEGDGPLLDEAVALIDGPATRVFGHVVVDEAQELTDMQWRMVLRRCPSRSMTVVGDFAQAGPLATATTWTEALGPHLGDRFETATLTVSYRTTAEILAGTRDLLARIAPGQTVTSIRHGHVPREITTEAGTLVDVLTADLAAEASAHPGDLVAVICTEARTAELAAGGVDRWARIVPATEARGLEFDAVVVVAPDEIVGARTSGERDLYVALTRATRRLCTIHVRR